MSRKINLVELIDFDDPKVMVRLYDDGSVEVEDYSEFGGTVGIPKEYVVLVSNAIRRKSGSHSEYETFDAENNALKAPDNQREAIAIVDFHGYEIDEENKVIRLPQAGLPSLSKDGDLIMAMFYLNIFCEYVFLYPVVDKEI